MISAFTPLSIRMSLRGFRHRAGLEKAWLTENAEHWIQRARERKDFEIVRIGAQRRLADICAKTVTHDLLERYVASPGCRAVCAGNSSA